jgi:hypothetical protein
MLSTFPEVSGPRSADEILEEVYRRAEVLRTRRARHIGAAVAAAVVVAGAATGLSVGTTSHPPEHVATPVPVPAQATPAQLALDQQLDANAGTEPQAQPVGSGWSAADPAIAPALGTQYVQWSPLVTSALKVLEHVAENGGSVTLSSIANQQSSQVAMSRGQYAGTSVSVDSLNGTVSDADGQSWSMTATSEASFTSGAAMFRGACVWTTTGTSTSGDTQTTQQTGKCTDVVVNLVVSPSDPYSATVSKWVGEEARTKTSSPNS